MAQAPIIIPITAGVVVAVAIALALFKLLERLLARRHSAKAVSVYEIDPSESDYGHGRARFGKYFYPAAIVTASAPCRQSADSGPGPASLDTVDRHSPGSNVTREEGPDLAEGETPLASSPLSFDEQNSPHESPLQEQYESDV